jgi:hypothetical protein
MLVILSVLAVLWVQLPRLADPFQADEDMRTFYWMSKFQAPALFPDDELGGHKYVNVRLPWGDLPVSFYSPGYSLLFYAASFLVPPILFSKLLPFFLMAVSVVYLLNYGESVGGTSTQA